MAVSSVQLLKVMGIEIVDFPILERKMVLKWMAVGYIFLSFWYDFSSHKTMISLCLRKVCQASLKEISVET